MPRKRITFIVIPPNDGAVREYKFAPRLLWLATAASVVLMAALGYYSFHFHTTVDQTALLSELHQENAQLVIGLQHVRTEVADLEGAMASLAEDDQKLRAWHLLPPLSADVRIGGIGGRDLPDADDMPEDYTRLPERKRALLEDMSATIYRLQRESLLQEESFELLTRKFNENAEELRFMPAMSPVPRLDAWKSSPFGKRRDPFTGDPAFHSGIDFAGRKGSPVYATADGVVVYAYTHIHLGNIVVIAHDRDQIDSEGNRTTVPGVYRTEYGHLEKMLVKKGEWVKRSQQIATLGNTGRSTGPHLHYAVRYQDRRRGGRRGYLDPEKFLLDWPKDETVSSSLGRTDE